MKVTLISLTEAAVEERDWRDLYAVEIDGKKVFKVYDGEPEDNTLGRNFNDVYKLGEIINTVHKAGKQGEDLVIEDKEVDEY